MLSFKFLAINISNSLLPTRNNLASHGVVVGEEYHGGRVFCTCLMSSGEIWTPNAQDVFFSIPSVVPADLASRCGSDEITDNKQNLHARVETLRRIRIVERALENAYSIVCSRAHGLYEQLRHTDPERWATTTLKDVAAIIDKNPSLIMTFAVHKFLMNNPAQFLAEHSYLSSKRFRVAPLSHVKDLETVEGWMRVSKGSPLASFAAKARGIMATNAKKLEDTFADIPCGGPSQHQWNEDDKVIIRFMTRALRPARSNQADPYAVPQSAILKLLDPEALTVRDAELQKVLINLGVLAPWQDLVVLQPQLDLDLEPEHRSQRVKQQNEMVVRGLERAQLAVSPQTTLVQGPLGPHDFYPTDPLDNVRHDFGTMKVYIVDDVDAQELDDGISIERIPSEPGHIWIHTHIADPGSLIPPTHTFAIEALKRQETAYFFPRTWPLFPRSLMHSPIHGLSLGSKEEGVPDRVLTFSAKVDQNANILDYKVRAGLVRNVKTVNYNTVDRALGVQPERHYPFGRVPFVEGNQTAPSSLPDGETRDFHDLLSFAKASILQRGKNDSYQIIEERSTLNGLSGSMPKDLSMRPTLEPFAFSGFPSMEYEVRRGDGTDVGARSIIAEAAKLACRIASRFALDNGNIPLLRRHVPRFMPNSAEDLRMLLDARTPEGYVENWLACKCVSLNPSSVYTLQPREHFVLGIPDGEGYVRATSPLRRYNDLMVHWQLHHALLGNRATSRKPPFDENDMEEYNVALTNFERGRKVMKAQHEKYWQVLFIHRWQEGVRLRKIDPIRAPSGNPMEWLYGRTLTRPVLDVEARKYQAEIHIPFLGLRALVELPDYAREMEIGSRLNVRVKELKLGVRPQIYLESKD